MTATDKTFKWIMWPLHGNQSIGSDEFIAEGFRIRLMGNRLEMSFEAPGTCSLDSAKALAVKYVEALGGKGLLMSPPLLLTEAEWLQRATPPFGGNAMTFFNQDDPSRIEYAVREARNELLTAADQTLRRCYDYLSDAQVNMHAHKNDVAAYAAYKAIELMERRFGGEGEAVKVLGKRLKKAKTAANNERHIPKKGLPQPKHSVEPVELTRQVIHEYERYLLHLTEGDTKSAAQED